MNRRGFLLGCAAAPVVAALPVVAPVAKKALPIAYGKLPAHRPVAIHRTGPDVWMIRVGGGAGVAERTYTFAGHLVADGVPGDMTFSLNGDGLDASNLPV